MADQLTLDTPRRTKEGYVAVRAKAARAGVYDYLGAEVDPEGKRFRATDTVKVYRSEDEVFDPASLHSFLMKPITDNHPSQSVTASNWKDLAGGVIAKAIRDGDHVAFDLVLMDEKTIAAVDSGKRELSNGYACELEFGDGVAPDGTPYQAEQRNIRGNHVAIVDRARGGSKCRIGDQIAVCDAISVEDFLDRRKPNENPHLFSPQVQSRDSKMPHVLIIDGLQVPNVSDEAKAAIEKLQGQLKDSTGTAERLQGDLQTATGSIAAKDGEIAVLKQQLADATDPVKRQQEAAARASLIGDAKRIHPTVQIGDAMTDAQIRKAVVDAKVPNHTLGDDEKAIGGAFSMLVATTPTQTNDSLRTVIASGVTNVADAAAVESAALNKANDFNSWRNQAA